MGTHPRVLTVLYVVDVALVLQIFLTWSEANELNDTQSSIDQDILEAYLSSNNSQQMHHPSVVRVQLDMLFPADVYADMINEYPDSDTSRTRRMRRTAMRGESLRWPNATVPYTLDASFNAIQFEELQKAMNDYQTYSCIRFREKLRGDVDYVRIIEEYGCVSDVGRQGGMQILSLTNRCRKKGTIMHELGHVLGLVHEHARPDRDQYISINTTNMLYEFQNDFVKFNELAVNVSGIPYDYESIMHYSEKMASANNKVVIETKNSSYQKIIGHVSTLSFRDVKLLNMIYRCSDRCISQIQSCPGEGFMGSDCQCWCPSGRQGVAAVHCTDIECGGVLVGSGTIRSPNFTGAYPSNVNCTWMLQPSSVDGGISLDIRHFPIDSSCHFVRIIDSSGEQLLLTGAIRKHSLLFIETSVKVSFTTNCSATSIGFEIAFSTISLLADSTCGSSLVDYGTIHSPNFPGSYPNSIRCTWTLQSSSIDSWIYLEIRSFSTESCCDIVKISDASGQELWLSGEQEPRQHFIRTPATVTFTTNAAVNDTGFEIVISNASVLPENCSFGWTANGNSCYRLTKRVPWPVAREECHSMNAFLVSIRNDTDKMSVYRFLYSKGVTSAWIGLNYLESEREWMRYYGEPVTHITRFLSEPNNGFLGVNCAEVRPWCYYRPWFYHPLIDVQPWDCERRNDYCGYWLPGVCMRAKGTVGNQLTFPKDNGSACGDVLLGSGIIRSPNFPERYPNNASCLWTLRTRSATGWIYLDIRSLRTEKCCDYVNIYDIAGNQLRLSGEIEQRRVILRSPANVFFTTDYSADDIGFEIAFNDTSTLPECLDVDHEFCQSEKGKGFCGPFFRRLYRRRCPRTCGYCS